MTFRLFKKLRGKFTDKISLHFKMFVVMSLLVTTRARLDKQQLWSSVQISCTDAAAAEAED